ncbi:MAG: hypothetical protein WCI57_02960 [Candidatus Berkelbacteria bacterium]
MFYLIIIIVALLWLKIYPSLDPDFGWHIALGKEMVQTKDLVHNFVGYNYFEKLFTIDHQWLSDILLYLTYHYIGYWFLALLFFAISVAIFWILYKSILKDRTDKDIAGLFVILAILSASLVYYGVRLQYLLLLAVVLLPYIYKTIKSFNLRLLLYFVIFALGSNLHGGFLILAPIPMLLELSHMNFDKPNRKNSLKNILFLGAALLLAFSTNPYGLEYWKFILGYWTSPYYKSHISEWLPIYSFPIRWTQVLLPLSLSIFFLTIEKYWKKVNKFELVLLLIYLYLGLTSLRAFPIFILLAMPYVAKAYEEIFRRYWGNFRTIKYAMYISATLLAALFASGISFTRFSSNIFDMDGSYPKTALNFLSENQPKSGNILNDYGWGGYQVWTHPEMKVFIDGRNPIPFVDGKKSMLEVYNTFFNGSDSEISDYLAKYDISVVMMKKPQAFKFNKLERSIYVDIGQLNETDLNSEPKIISYLNSNRAWAKVYSDNMAYIWKKAE